jgi:hypothetical protein
MCSAFGFNSALFGISRLQNTFCPSVCHLSILIFPVVMEFDLITRQPYLTTVDSAHVFKYKNHQLSFEP